MQGAILTKIIPLTNLTAVGNYIVGVPHSHYGTISVSRCYEPHNSPAGGLEQILICLIRYLFFRFGKRIRGSSRFASGR